MAYETKLIETYPGFGPTVVNDGSMETDPVANWTAAAANLTVQTANVHGGCRSLQVQATGPGGNASQNLTVVPGHRYRIGVWGLRSAAGHRWRVQIWIGTLRWTSNWHDNAAWEEEVKFYRIPNTITTITVALVVETAGEIVYFDDVTCCREAPAPIAAALGGEIDLMFRATDDWSLLQQGIRINDPRMVEIWGGELEDQLVRREEGKRVIPVELNLVAADADTLIDDVNELEGMLRHAAAFRTEGKRSGYGEVFLQFKTDGATHSVWYPVILGQINKTALMKKCGGDDLIDKVPVVIICEAYWESLYTYDLANLLDNPGFEEWNNADACPNPICDCQPDCWDDFENFVGGGSGENYQETEVVKEGCEALRIEVLGLGAGDYKGVTQDIVARLRDDTMYTLLVWVQNDTAITNNGVIRVMAHGSATGVTYALNSGAANADYTLYSCQFRPSGDAWLHIRAFIEGIAPGNCTGIVHIDKLLVMEASNVPTGWMSSSYLTNHYDRDENEVNFLSVCDIPGEVDAEIRATLVMDDVVKYVRVAKRTRNTPCAFPWQLIPCEAYTEAEGGVGAACTPVLISASCKDSDKIADVSSPSGSHIEVDFGTVKTMALRCYWRIESNLRSHYGKFALLVIAKRSNTTDNITMQIESYDPANIMGLIHTNIIAATSWTIYDGWEILSYRIGTQDNDFIDGGNNWRIRLHAATDAPGAAATDLLIAGAYLMPLDESALLAGSDELSFGLSETDMIIKEMDGDRGVFGYTPLWNGYYYPNVGAVGSYPLLTPEVENWLYFVLTSSTLDAYTLDDTFKVSFQYRPRGIFLRGTNP